MYGGDGDGGDDDDAQAPSQRLQLLRVWMCG
jgi:hypothetical protein